MLGWSSMPSDGWTSDGGYIIGVGDRMLFAAVTVNKISGRAFFSMSKHGQFDKYIL